MVLAKRDIAKRRQKKPEKLLPRVPEIGYEKSTPGVTRYGANMTTDTTAAVTKFAALAAALRGVFFEREPEIRALFVALIARQNVLLLGDPGTGKSALTNALTAAIAPAPTADEPPAMFTLLLNKFTTLDEAFGPISLQGLENDEYRRVTKGYLPTARVAFLDEIFKCNSAMLNALLTVLNERAFDDGGRRVRIPLEIAIGASNELPADGEGLEALYDRFTVRRWVDSVKSRDNMRAMLRMKGEPTIAVKVTPDELAAVRALADSVTVPDAVLDAMLDLRDALAQKHGLTASERRWRKCEGLVRASAALDGRNVAKASDLLILADALWNAPDERAKIRGVIADAVSPDLAAAQRIHDAAIEACGRIDMKTADVAALGKLNQEVKAMLAEVNKLDAEQIGDIAEKVGALHQSVARATYERLGFGTAPKAVR